MISSTTSRIERRKRFAPVPFVVSDSTPLFAGSPRLAGHAKSPGSGAVPMDRGTELHLRDRQDVICGEVPQPRSVSFALIPRRAGNEVAVIHEVPFTARHDEQGFGEGVLVVI